MACIAKLKVMNSQMGLIPAWEYNTNRTSFDIEVTIEVMFVQNNSSIDGVSNAEENDTNVINTNIGNPVSISL